MPTNLAENLNTEFHLRSVVASRHSYETGTLRFFPALFIDDGRILATPLPKGDGYVFYDISVPKTGRRDRAAQPSLFDVNLTPQPPLLQERGRSKAEGVRLPVIRVTSTKTNALRQLARGS